MSLLNRKDSIVITAIEIMSELGIQGLTTKEIARRQGISEGTIFRYFRSKNEIILSMLKEFSRFDKDIRDSVLDMDLNFAETCRVCINTYSDYYESYPAITALSYSYDGLMNEARLADYVRGILNARINFIKELVTRGKERGEIPPHIDAEGLADIMGGTFRTIVYIWRLSKYSFSLKDRMISTLDMILENFALK